MIFNAVTELKETLPGILKVKMGRLQFFIRSFMCGKKKSRVFGGTEVHWFIKSCSCDLLFFFFNTSTTNLIFKVENTNV